MLSFFRRYEKTFLLVIFAPALIGMGITGAIISVLTDQGDQVAGRLFDQEINQKEFDSIRNLYRRTTPNAGDEEAWRFFALLQAARRSGLSVSDREVGEQIHTTISWSIARMKALEEIKAQGVDISTQAGQDKFREIMLRYIIQDKPDFNPEDYRRAVREQEGLSVKNYEEQQKREALVQRYLAVLRELAVVEPNEVWEAYQERYHKRVLELIEVKAELHAPDLAAKEGTPGFISDEQVDDYYKSRAVEYDEPRSVDMEYVAFSFADAETEIDAPGDDELKSFNALRGIAPVDSFDELVDSVRDAFFKEKAHDRVEAVMDAVADRVDAAIEKGGGVDMAAIASAVKQSMSCQGLKYKATGMITREGLEADGMLSGFAAARWFDRRGKGDMSDVVGGPDGWYFIRTKDVKHARTPPYEDIKAQVRKDYANGSAKEILARYEANKTTDYRRPAEWRLEVILSNNDAFGGDSDKAREALEQAITVARDWKKGYGMLRFQTDPDVKAASKFELQEIGPLGREAITTHELLGKLGPLVVTMEEGQVHLRPEIRGDEKGWLLLKIKEKLAVREVPFEECEDQVAQDVRAARALDRAEVAAEALMSKLRSKRGEALTQALEELKLETIKTEAFGRDADSLEGIPSAGKLVSEAYSAQAEVGGPFSRVVRDPEGGRAVLLRVAEKSDAGQEDYALQYPSIRIDLLGKKRGDFAAERIRDVTLRAKGITSEHLAFAREVRDGVGGASRVTLRQIFISPDKAILEQWLEKAALDRIKEAQGALAGGSAWGTVVDRFSEDDLTRTRGGELPPASRGEFAPDFGVEFEEAVFAISTKNVTSGPIRSTKGYHLVQYVGDDRGRRQLQHLLVSLDPKIRKLPKEVQDKADAASKKKIEEALAALSSGRAFGKVAEQFGDARDPHGQGQELEMDYVTALERAALDEFLEWELPEGHAGVGDMNWAPDAVEVKSASGSTWQLFACSRDPSDRGAAWEARFRRNRKVFHIQASDKAKIDSVRAELLEFIASRIEEQEDRPSWAELLRQFQTLAREHSEVPSAKKGGALGLLQIEDSVRPYGAEFLQRACYRADGSVVEPGDQTGVFRGETGYDIVQVVEVEKVPLEDEERRTLVAQSLLTGTDWQ